VTPWRDPVQNETVELVPKPHALIPEKSPVVRGEHVERKACESQPSRLLEHTPHHRAAQAAPLGIRAHRDVVQEECLRKEAELGGGQ
jgi:hypothetical protein